jgi:diaminohydroxyphosphoribosylaminopyrimidine deaminase/5-amino-6-(5-phosphoribosylamino)uracil reductase
VIHPLHPIEALTLQLAQQAIGLSSPNPRVGCVITHAEGAILGQGHTQAAGQAHAEVMALQHASSQGYEVAGATAWVSLEPCAHHGRTPPCYQALIQAQIAEVVVAVQDPNPLVAGKGLQALRDAGIRVRMGSPDWAQAATDLNVGFFSRMQRQRPYVRLKAAASLDGTTALCNGTSQWITSEAARTDGHHWRHRACAILTGIGTVLHDNPRLDVRLGSISQTALQPIRVVLDTHLRIPADARVLQAPGLTLIYTSNRLSPEHTQRQQQLEQAWHSQGMSQYVEIIPTPCGPRLSWEFILHDLGRRQINELHIEAGHTVNGSALREGWVDELLLYVAPCLLGQGMNIASLEAQPLQSLAQGVALQFIECIPIGPDLRIRASTRSPISAMNSLVFSSPPTDTTP